jgi:hypothetical protein
MKSKNLIFRIVSAILLFSVLSFAYGDESAQPKSSAAVPRFIKAVYYPAMYKAMAKGVSEQLASSNNPNDENFRTALIRLADIPEDKLLPPLVKVFQKEITDEEASELADFFESEAGKKALMLSSKLLGKSDADKKQIMDEIGNQLTNDDKLKFASIMQKPSFHKYSQLLSNLEIFREVLRGFFALPEFSDLNVNNIF